MATQSVRIGWRPYVNVVTQVVNAVDADATAFITAAGITNLTQASAINTLVNDLKTYGLWTKMKALYPMVGGSATSHKFNLKDPRDLNAAFRLVFNGGWTHTSSGALSNGTTGYADTFLVPSLTQTLNSNGLGFYVTSNTASLGDPIQMGANNTSTQSSLLGAKTNTTVGGRLNGGVINCSISNNSGHFSIQRTSSTLSNVYQNTTLIGSGNSGGSLPNVSMYIGNINNNNVPYAPAYVNSEFRIAYISDGLSNTDVANFYNSIQKFQTTLGRQIGSPIVSDTDAQAFLNAAGITDLGQANAVNTLVVDLKAAGVWTKMKAIYPFVGGTAAAHKFNLKDPRDLDAAFRLAFNGGWVHSSTGVLPNGTTGYANTFLASNAMGQNNIHVSIYSRTDTDGLYSDIGGGAGSSYVDILLKYVGRAYLYVNTSQGDYYTNPSSTGLYIANRIVSGAVSLFKNNTKVINGNRQAQTPTTYNLYLAAENGAGTAGLYSPREQAFASIGDGLTDTEAANFYTAVQKYQTTLGRQVGTPVLASGQTAGLLDTYSSATVAYSLRKLRNGYYGFAIRVRRSSDNAEQDIAFKSDGTLDTTSLLAFVGSGNGFVTTWYDQSGLNNHITQTTAANQPSIVLLGVLNTQNSKPVILTDGSSFMINSSVSWNLTTNSIFATIKLNASRGAMAMMSSVGTSNQHFVSRNTNGTGRYYDSASQEITAAALPNGFNLISIHENSSGVTVFENGANLVTNFAHDTGGAVIGVVIFKRDAGNGLTSGSGFSELIIYGSTSQLSNNSVINTNINSYYSIY